MQRLLDDGVSSRRGVMNTHLELSAVCRLSGSLEHSEVAQRCGVILPLLPKMAEEMIGTVASALLGAVGR
jgi:hypothetical protein